MASRLEDALLRLVEVLEDNAVGYAVTGSFALAYHGVVRATNDVDVKVVAADFSKRSERVIAELTSKGFMPLDGTSFRYAGVFDAELYLILDDIDAEAYQRRVQDRLLTTSDKKFWMVRAEDLVLIKLREYRRVGDYKHIDDIKKLLVARKDLDLEYLDARVEEHGFRKLWKRHLEGPGEPPG